MADGGFRLYCDGNVHLTDARVTTPVSFAHVTDLHLPPDPPDLWPEPYHDAIEWWDIEEGRPNRVLPGMLDEIRSAGVDFVFFGGDVLDYYHPEPAERVAQMCRQRGLKAHFQLGNHDWESDYIRYVTHELDRDVRASACRELGRHWEMPGPNYGFDLCGVRFVALDTPYDRVAEGWKGRFDAEQAAWLTEQLCHHGPIVVFHHVPFNLPTVEYRLRAVWNGILGCVSEDEHGRRVKSAIGQCSNVLGTFTGHSHMRSEDPLGGTLLGKTAE